MESSAPMMSITTSNSISVKPPCRLPVMIGNAVQSLAGGEGVDVEYVVARLRIPGRACVAAQPPGFLGCNVGVGKEGIARNPAQEVELHLLLAGGVFHPGVEQFEIRRVARFADLHLDVTARGCCVIVVDRLADLAKRGTQFRFLFALRDELRQRHCGRREQSENRQCDYQLDQGEAARSHDVTVRWRSSAVGRHLYPPRRLSRRARSAAPLRWWLCEVRGP